MCDKNRNVENPEYKTQQNFWQPRDQHQPGVRAQHSVNDNEPTMAQGIILKACFQNICIKELSFGCAELKVSWS